MFSKVCHSLKLDTHFQVRLVDTGKRPGKDHRATCKKVLLSMLCTLRVIDFPTIEARL